ncbi:MAG: hypothetical protein Q6364_02145 [Candidatus Hermodarchaeota archaeon]|nr:hypothetical protein [Candidatus Hermodarchaeota archaeon]
MANKEKSDSSGKELTKEEQEKLRLEEKIKREREKARQRAQRYIPIRI